MEDERRINKEGERRINKILKIGRGQKSVGIYPIWLLSKKTCNLKNGNNAATKMYCIYIYISYYKYSVQKVTKSSKG